MSLLDSVKSELKPAGTRCKLVGILEKLPKSEAAELRQMIAAGKDEFPGAAIGRALTKRGHQITGANIQECRSSGHAH